MHVSAFNASSVQLGTRLDTWQPSLSRSEAREKNVDVVRDWDLSVTSQLMKRSAQHTQA
jgi:hypothetical protein